MKLPRPRDRAATARAVCVAALTLACACSRVASPTPASYLFVWAGDAENKASDFLGVINADPRSAEYGAIVASLATGTVGTHPHHTEHEMPPGGHLLANGFHAGRTWLFDLTEPLQPRIAATFAEVAGFSHPHTYIRTADGRVLATFQYATGDAVKHEHGTAAANAAHTTGGLVEMDERGQPVRSGAASDSAISDQQIFPYSVLPMPSIDRAVSSTTDMDENNTAATSEWLQFWRLSDLKLLRSIALEPGPRGDEHQLTGELRLLPDGQSVYIHTFNCGLYLLRNADQPEPRISFVRSFEGKDCGVPVLTGHYWLQPVPASHALVALDIADPERPREVSSVSVGDDEEPHWVAIDPTGRRVVLNSGGYARSNRLFLIDFDPATGKLSIDESFREPGSSRPGIDLNAKTWPHGFTGRAQPHGTVFSR
jgi:hypothetical protein